MKKYSEIKNQVHDISGVSNPEKHLYEQKNGIYYPVAEIAGTIDVTPTWSALIPVMLDLQITLGSKRRLSTILP
jgi:hypothetical protein